MIKCQLGFDFVGIMKEATRSPPMKFQVDRRNESTQCNFDEIADEIFFIGIEMNHHKVMLL